MTIDLDLDRQENLLLQSSKAEFIHGLSYFSSVENENPNNIFYVLTRSTGLRDIDIKFIITFLKRAKYIEVIDGRICGKLKIVPSIVIEELVFFYYALLANNQGLNNSLFINSELTITNDEIFINVFSVNVKHRIFFTILRQLGMLVNTNTNGIIKIKNYILAKKILERPLRKISPEELEDDLQQKKLDGILAEKFVVRFETQRLNGFKKIDWVAQYVVNNGYDISSFDDVSDKEYNRFIEVKSYEGNTPQFYWSKNEYMVAERMKEKYWLYLVNREEMSYQGYIPIMIQDPYRLLTDTSVSKTIETYKINIEM